MYDDLILRLRDAAKMSDALAVLLPHSEGNAVAKLYNEAADAIEELATNYDAATDIMKHQTEYIEELEANKPRWIPVTERLPELIVPCLVYNKSQPTMVGWRIDDKRFRIPGSYLPDHPTHWMPLPKPPEEE